MTVLGYFGVALPFYFAWAAVWAQGYFHLVWSSALSALTILISLLQYQIFPLSITIVLYLLTVVVLVLCIVLSPLQRVFCSAVEVAPPDQKRIQIYYSKSSRHGSSPLVYACDIIAVHGLALNGATAWNSRNHSIDGSAPMWLRDFLPHEELDARIMAFNHNTGWETNALSKSLRDHGEDLLRALKRVRQTTEEQSRPIIFIGHSFGGLIIKQALVIAGEDPDDTFQSHVRRGTQGFIFLGTPHKGAHLTGAGKMQALLGYWSGSSTSLLEVIKPNSMLNKDLHEAFMRYLRGACGTENTLCVFETVTESLYGYPTVHVVDEASAVIDGSQKIGFEKRHREIQRFTSPDDDEYKDMLDWMRRLVDSSRQLAQASMQEKTEGQKACLRSLAFPEMGLRGNDITDEAEHTCAWLLQHDNYQSWLAQPRGLLWIKGKPGAGKSTLMKYALRNIQQEENCPASQGLVIASFFFHGRSPVQIQKSALGLYRSVLHQILDQVPDLLCKVTSVYKDKRDKLGEDGVKWNWDVAELRSILEYHIPSSLEVCKYSIRIYVDALDEAGDKVARELIQDFQRLIAKVNPENARGTLNICFSCRHYPILALDYGLHIDVDKEKAHDIDIAKYVNLEFQREHPNDRKTQMLEKGIVNKANGVFLWVVLVVHIILRHLRDGKNLAAAFKKLDSTPAELDELYQQIIQSKDGEDRSHSLLLFQWVCFARNPLSFEELRFAMVLDLDTSYSSLRECQDSEYFAESDEVLGRLIRTLSGGLVEVRMMEEISYLQFIHQSVYDYLLKTGLKILDSSAETNVIGRAHFCLSRACTKYMMMKEISSMSPNAIQSELWTRSPQFPLLRYAATHFIWHWEELEEECYTQKDLAKDFLISLDNMVQKLDSVSYGRTESMTGKTLLHLASEFNLQSIVNAVLEQNVIEPNSKNKYGQTPLLLAVKNRSKAVVELLLQRRDADPNLKDNSGQTPLSLAAENGHKAVVELLLQRRDADPNSKDKSGQTPLLLAAENGHKAVIELLLQRRDTDPNSKNNSGQTPLLLAARFGYEATVELLLQRNDVDSDFKDNNGTTPLSWAARSENKAVIELLLFKGAEPDSKDNNGCTPLSWAAQHGQQAVIELLLSKGVDPDSKDKDGRTPLSFAAECSSQAVVELLLSKGVDPDSKDKDGRTPLSWAAEYGSQAVVELLLSKGVDLDSKHKDGRTPLSFAAGYGPQILVELMLSTGVDPVFKRKDGRTPRLFAPGYERQAVIELLLFKGAEPDSKDNNSRTPLSWAAQQGHEAVVELLLFKGVDPDSKDKDDWTPLSWAAQHEQHAVIELLLSKDAAPDSEDYSGRTLESVITSYSDWSDEETLSRARASGHSEQVVNWLESEITSYSDWSDEESVTSY